MAYSREFAALVLDLLDGLGGIAIRRMFGGAGLYRDATMFALIADDVLYLRTDGQNRPDFEAAGMAPFKPFADKPMLMPYHEAPPELFEDAAEMTAWAGRAWDAARRNRKLKK